MRYLFCLLVAGFLITSCQSEGPSKVVTTENGSRYSLFSTNRTGEPAKIGEYVYFHASMRTEGDSTMFSTRDNGGEPQMIQIRELDASDQPVSPVEDVLALMAQGDSAVIRVNMNQFPSKPPGLENDTVLLYTIAVAEVLDEASYVARLSEEELAAKKAREEVLAREEERLAFADGVLNDYKSGKLDGELQTTETGLKYIIHQEGAGEQPTNGNNVSVQYIGQLVSDGSVFDQSFGRGEPITFALGVGQVIPGWDEGIANLKPGAQATLFIPSELGYGARGAGSDIPANSELAFYVELVNVQ